MKQITQRYPKTVYLILLNIRSVLNVGSIFRTADAAGVSKIFLVGYTPSPKDRFGNERADLAKVALGAEKNVAWESLPQILPLIKKLKKENFQIIALEQDKRAVDYKKIKTKNKIAIILGNETSGISKNVLKNCDLVGEISMLGKKESLNVAVSTGIFLFRVLGI
ncbi:TrmH family RNA methyltransferase [Candidatus Nomurabacteria bacterium]|nr:TrmH family RNA methyltransferase [Candidatus Nomurabacteria bacterium]